MVSEFANLREVHSGSLLPCPGFVPATVGYELQAPDERVAMSVAETLASIDAEIERRNPGFYDRPTVKVMLP